MRHGYEEKILLGGGPKPLKPLVLMNEELGTAGYSNQRGRRC